MVLYPSILGPVWLGDDQRGTSGDSGPPIQRSLRSTNQLEGACLPEICIQLREDQLQQGITTVSL